MGKFATSPKTNRGTILELRTRPQSEHLSTFSEPAASGSAARKVTPQNRVPVPSTATLR